MGFPFNVYVLISAAFEARELNVWVDEIGQKAGMDFLNKIGQAIIDAKV